MKYIWKLVAVIAIVSGLASCSKDKTIDKSGGCEAVDLGLSVKWASYNVGALNVDGHGSYFAWGGKWRTPTKQEIDELLDAAKCEWTWDDTRKGYIVRGLKTGNSIFLPAAGFRSGNELILDGAWGYYWSSSVAPLYPSLAEGFGFSSAGKFCGHDSRRCGRSVRAVME